MSTDDIYHIYSDRWIIETNYNKLKKNRLEIENYTSDNRKNITQNVYSTVINYNVVTSYIKICNKLVENKFKKK